jgi:hypothetical protein
MYAEYNFHSVMHIIKIWYIIMENYQAHLVIIFPPVSFLSIMFNILEECAVSHNAQ